MLTCSTIIYQLSFCYSLTQKKWKKIKDLTYVCVLGLYIINNIHIPVCIGPQVPLFQYIPVWLLWGDFIIYDFLFALTPLLKLDFMVHLVYYYVVLPLQTLNPSNSSFNVTNLSSRAQNQYFKIFFITSSSDSATTDVREHLNGWSSRQENRHYVTF